MLLLLLQAGSILAQGNSPQPESDSTPEALVAHRQAVEEEQAAIARARERLGAAIADLPQKLSELETGPVSELLLEQARLDAQSIRVRQEDLRLEIADAERRVEDLKQSIRDLEARQQLLSNPAKHDAASAAELERIAQSLSERRTELELATMHGENLRQELELIDRRIPLLNQWRSRIEQRYQQQQEQQRRAAQESLEQHLRQEQQAQLSLAEELRRQLVRERDTLSEAARRLLELRIRIALGRAELLIGQDRRSARIDAELRLLEGLAEQSDADAQTVQEGLSRLRALQQELENAGDLFERATALAEQHRQLLEQPAILADPDNRKVAAEALGHLLQGLNQRQSRIRHQLERTEALRPRLEAVYQASLGRDLLARRPLPATAAEWQQVLAGLIQAPRVLFHQVRLSVDAAVATAAGAGVLRWSGLMALELGLLGLLLWTRRAVRRALARAFARDPSLFVHDVSLILLLLLQRNLVGIGLTLALLLVVWIMRVPQPGLGIIVTLMLLGVGISLLITLARLLLTSGRLPVEQRHPRLYRHLSTSLVIGGVLTAVTIVAHMSALDESVVGMFDRLFMLYLLLMFLLLLSQRRFFQARQVAEGVSRLWRVGQRLPGLVLVVALAATALLGLAGYLSLAWTLAWYVGLFSMMLAAWLFARRVLDDLAVWLKNYAVMHSGYALLWTQDVINPLHRLLRVLLFLGLFAMLAWVYGWYGEAAMLARVWEYLNQTRFTLGGAQISLWHLLITGLSVLGLIWLGRWIRTITYRWIFSRIVDLGVRHSLSVLLQYAIVLIGFLFILRAMGLNLTTLAVFAGAVGVGIGLGMQSIASNFVSGLLLLIERPLRSGDIVSVGSHDGTVSRIGIRSTTVKTFDNLEVIIPNAEVANSAFTNWTHSDNIIRSVIMVGVSYDDDPGRVVTLLELTIDDHPAVLKEPPPLVLFWEYGESALLFRVQFYTDLSQANVLVVRSEVRSRIWYALKAAGIRIPYPQRDVHVRDAAAEQQPARGDRLVLLSSGRTPAGGETAAAGDRTRSGEAETQ